MGFLRNPRAFMTDWLAAVLYVATIFAANWAIVTYGVIPVGFGLMAPAAVIFAGLAFTLRDFIAPRALVLGAIAVGTLCTFAISGPLAIASGAAFAFSEIADYLVYTRLRTKRAGFGQANWLVAILGSNAVGLVLDSVIFLWLAFGSFAFLAGQIVGKVEMTLIALPVIWALRRAFPRERYKLPAWPLLAAEE